MVDMSIVVEDAIAEHVSVAEDGWFDAGGAAEAAIAAATPFIRAQVLDELIAEAAITFDGAVYFCEDGWVRIEDWLRERKVQS